MDRSSMVHSRRVTLTTAAVTAVAELLGVDATTVATDAPFADLGLNSTSWPGSRRY